MDDVMVIGSMLTFASSKLRERDANEPSGLVAPPSHIPIKGTDTASVAVGGRGVGDGSGVAFGEVQAASIHSNIRFAMIRMLFSIFQRVEFIITPPRGIIIKHSESVQGHI